MPNKIYIAGRNQTKTVTPSNIQQTIEADTGYNALDSVVVNPIKAAMPQTIEQFIMRNDNIEPFSLNLDGAVPSYACYQQKKLVEVYGIQSSIGSYAFNSCTKLQAIDCRTVSSIGSYAFSGCDDLALIDLTDITSNITINTAATFPPNTNLVILVANDTVKAHYQSATNWSDHASQIKTIAELEQEIGMSYDNYYEIVFGHSRF
jgi:hypothetical protein